MYFHQLNYQILKNVFVVTKFLEFEVEVFLEINALQTSESVEKIYLFLVLYLKLF